MADTRQRTTLGNRFRFLVRFVGLTGFMVAAVGGALAAVSLPSVQPGAWAGWDLLRAAYDGNHGETAQVGTQLLFGGLIAVAVALVVELLGTLFLGAGRRTAAGTVAGVGIVAALALLVTVNVYSFTHSARYDVTRDQRFTLPPDLAAELGKLRGSAPTTIVVLQAHNTFGTLSTKRDSFTSAAERQVTEKVQDLVDQFRAFGPQFKVVVLDTEAFGYQGELDALTKDAPELKAAIEAAQENSIFFSANKRVQRLSFNEFMQLDKTASREADDGRGNLVLVPQGIDRFARKILAVQERRPKVAVCVVHEALSTARSDSWRAPFTLAGLRKSLTDAGFEVTDVVLKRWGEQGPSVAADTREESTLERLEAEEAAASAELTEAATVKTALDSVRSRLASVKGRPWPERRAVYAQVVRGTPTEAAEPQILALVDKESKRADEALKEAQEAAADVAKRLAAARKDERPLQDRRTADPVAKFARQLADVDLLIVPRFTVENAIDEQSQNVRAGLHALNREQVKVVKEFMKSGKPVLACLGPVTPRVAPARTESPEDFDKQLMNRVGGQIDEFEKLLAERGIELGNSLVLYAGETKALVSDQFGTGPAEIPPLVLPDPPGGDQKPNPVSEAVRLTGRAAEKGLDLRMRAARPLGLAPGWQAKQPFAAEILFTVGGAGSWNDLQPYPRIGLRADGSSSVIYKPKPEETAADDPRKGTRDEERRGPHAVGLAIENKIPAAWVNPEYEREQSAAALLSPRDGVLAAALTVAADQVERPTQRTIVYGSGGVFAGKDLTPAQEKLLFHSVNWLTGREEQLPKPAAAENPEWRYPRVAMSEGERKLWTAGALFGLPLLVAYAGLIATLRRRMR